MKAGIITFASAHNYGAVYQVYAMQEFLKSLGIDAHVINYRPKEIDNVYKIYKIKSSKNMIKKILKKSKKIILVNTLERWKVKKYKNFENFINNTLNTTKEFKTLSEINNAYLDYDVLIAGSDQIWNTKITKKFNPVYFLEFGKPEAVRIAYAASLGSEIVEDDDKELFKRYLKNFDYISIREENSKKAIEELTDKDVAVVLDPTLLVDKSVYDNLKVKSKYHNKKYIYVHFIGVDERLIKVAEAMSKKLNLPIVHNYKKGTFSNELKARIAVSPAEMLDVIDSAQYIVSNSFHFTVLPIIYSKNFITIPHATRPQRMQDLLKKLNLSDHLVEDVKDIKNLEKLKINYKDVHNKIVHEREKSICFLKESLKNGKIKPKNYFESKDKYDCYGCGLCASICPKKAITMVEDEEGFVYPRIDETKCIKCGLCEKQCIYHNNKTNNNFKEEVYAIQNIDEETLKKSTSGGVFIELAKAILNKKGYVVGVRYNENMEPIYDITNNKEVVKLFMGSKYVAPLNNDIYEKVKEKLDNNNYVLFVGSPCKIAALRKFLKKEYDKLYIVNIICHGTPSPKIFKNYIKYLERKYNKKIKDFKFRYKENGWNKSYIKVIFQDESEKIELASYNNFNRNFLDNMILRPSCYNCEFASNINISDLTIGDYWKIEKFIPELANNKGTSLIKLNTSKGKELFEEIKGNFMVRKSNYCDAYYGNHKMPCVLTKKRIEFMKNFDFNNVDQYLESNNRFKNKNKKLTLKQLEENKKNSI